MITARSNDSIKPLKVLVCLVTLVAFLFNTISYDFAWAAGTPSGLPGGSSDRAGGSGFKQLSPDTFTLPEYLGNIKDAWSSPNPQTRTPAHSLTIIHIQDAHCNYAAQHKIAEIIEYLNKKYGIDSINLEGGAKGYDLSIFTNITDKSIREKTADYFVKEGLVNGAEYFAINNPEKATLWGVEDTKLYIDNLKIYRDSLKHKDEVDQYLNALTRTLNSLKTKIYSKELLELDTKYSQYKAGNLEFKDYLAYLIRISPVIAKNSLPNISLLSQTLSEEGDVDFKKANNERDDLIDKLQKKLSKKSLEELVLKTVEFRSERISQKDFYAYLSKKADYVGIELKDFPEFQKYVAYISMYAAIDKTKIMEEVGALEQSIKETVIARSEATKQSECRTLDKLSKNLAILKNIFNISLTREDYKYYLDNAQSFDVSNYIAFIDKETSLIEPVSSMQTTAMKQVQFLDRYRADILKFYEYSSKRDSAFMKNLPVIARRPKADEAISKPAILITGGFHTENLTDLFKQNNISYISIMPNFTNDNSYQCPYFKILSGEKNIWIQDVLPSILNSSMATAAELCPAMSQAMVGAGLMSPPSTEPSTVEPSAAPAIPEPAASDKMDSVFATLQAKHQRQVAKEAQDLAEGGAYFTKAMSVHLGSSVNGTIDMQNGTAENWQSSASYLYIGPVLTMHGYTEDGIVYLSNDRPAADVINELAEREGIRCILLVACNPENGDLGRINIPVIYSTGTVAMYGEGAKQSFGGWKTKMPSGEVLEGVPPELMFGGLFGNLTAEGGGASQSQVDEWIRTGDVNALAGEILRGKQGLSDDSAKTEIDHILDGLSIDQQKALYIKITSILNPNDANQQRMGRLFAERLRIRREVAMKRDFAAQDSEILFDSMTREFKLLLAAMLRAAGSQNSVRSVLASSGPIMGRQNSALVSAICAKLANITNADKLVRVVNAYAVSGSDIDRQLTEVVEMAKLAEYGGKDYSVEKGNIDAVLNQLKRAALTDTGATVEPAETAHQTFVAKKLIDDIGKAKDDKEKLSILFSQLLHPYVTENIYKARQSDIRAEDVIKGAELIDTTLSNLLSLILIQSPDPDKLSMIIKALNEILILRGYHIWLSIVQDQSGRQILSVRLAVIRNRGQERTYKVNGYAFPAYHLETIIPSAIQFFGGTAIGGFSVLGGEVVVYYDNVMIEAKTYARLVRQAKLTSLSGLDQLLVKQWGDVPNDKLEQKIFDDLILGRELHEVRHKFDDLLSLQQIMQDKTHVKHELSAFLGRAGVEAAGYRPYYNLHSAIRRAMPAGGQISSDDPHSIASFEMVRRLLEKAEGRRVAPSELTYNNLDRIALILGKLTERQIIDYCREIYKDVFNAELIVGSLVTGHKQYDNEEAALKDFVTAMAGAENMLQRKLIIAVVLTNRDDRFKNQAREFLKSSESEEILGCRLTSDIMRDYLELRRPENYEKFSALRNTVVPSARFKDYDQAAVAMRQKTIDFLNILAGIKLNGMARPAPTQTVTAQMPIKEDIKFLWETSMGLTAYWDYISQDKDNLARYMKVMNDIGNSNYEDLSVGDIIRALAFFTQFGRAIEDEKDVDDLLDMTASLRVALAINVMARGGVTNSGYMEYIALSRTLDSRLLRDPQATIRAQLIERVKAQPIPALIAPAPYSEFQRLLAQEKRRMGLSGTGTAEGGEASQADVNEWIRTGDVNALAGHILRGMHSLSDDSARSEIDRILKELNNPDWINALDRKITEIAGRNPSYNHQQRMFGLFLKLLQDYREAAEGESGVSPHRVAPQSPNVSSVIVMGGSCFGYEAIEEIFRKLPPHHPPIVVAEHLVSRLDAIEIPEITGMRINFKEQYVKKGERIYLKDDMFVIARQPYIQKDAAGNYYLLLDYGYHVHDGDVNYLFASAAAYFNKNVTCVVLSGFGNDGVNGARIVYENGGRVIVEKTGLGHPLADESRSMPRNVLNAGMPCREIDISDMASTIINEQKTGAQKIEPAPSLPAAPSGENISTTTISRRQLLKGASAASIGASIGTVLGLWATSSSHSNLDVMDLNIPERLANKLTSRLAGYGATPDSINRSIQLSNSPRQQELVTKAYKKLHAKGAWGSDRHYPVLFLSGFDRKGFAVALVDLGIIVVPLEDSPKDEVNKIGWIGTKIAHEGVHIMNHHNNPSMNSLEDEWRAYENTARAVKIFEPQNIEQIAAQKKVSDAFGILVQKKKTVEKLFQRTAFGNLYYDKIDLKGDFVGIGLFYNETHQIVWVNVTTGEIGTQEPVFKYIQSGEPALRTIAATVMPISITSIVTTSRASSVAATSLVSDINAVEIRQTTTIDRLNGSEGKDNIVKIVVALPGDLENDLKRNRWVSNKLSKALGDKGFGLISSDTAMGRREGDGEQIIPCYIYTDNSSPEATEAAIQKTQESFDEAIKKAETLLAEDLTKAPANTKGRIVVFAPQIENGPKLAEKARETYRGHGNVTVVPDAYTDSNPRDNIYPDIMIRVALGRDIAFYYTGKDPQGSLTSITELLAKVADNNLAGVADLDALLKKLYELALRIRPVDYNGDVRNWQRSQEYVATAL